MEKKELVRYVANVDRVAGYSTSEPPPKDIVGKKVELGRPLINTHGYWIEYKGEKYVILHAEVFDGTTDQCDCRDCKMTRGARKLKKMR